MLTKQDQKRLRILYSLLVVGCIAVLLGAPAFVVSISAFPGMVYFFYALYAFAQEQVDLVRALTSTDS